MSEQQSSYRQIIKATSLFGGVQVFQILIQIIRSKFVAVLLGPAGMGIVGLLTSTIGLIGGLTNFGLGTSAVKNIAEAAGTEDNNRIATTIVVLRRLVWVTGLLGMLITLIFSPWLSQLTFGNKNYSLAFVVISITLLFNQLTSGQMVLLQGMRKLQYLAKANLYGSGLGLLITIPLYYKWGIDAIVPVLIMTSLVSLSLSWFFSSKIKIQTIKVLKNKTIVEGKDMLKMGFMISLGGMIGAGFSYILRIFISRSGSIEDVGLYSAGFTLIGTYFGLIFTAMGTDYYPRLSSVVNDDSKVETMINEQAEIAILILAPILCVFLIFINWVVILLYSNKFIQVNDMIHWVALGMYFKAASWSMGFIFLAKGNTKLFFWNELITDIYLLLFNIIGYKLWGLTGLGISSLITYLAYFIQVIIITKKTYNFSFNKGFIRIMSIQFTIGFICFLIVKFINVQYSNIFGTLAILVSISFSLYEFNKRINLCDFFRLKNE